jgi:hypothetical protein
VTAVLRRWLGLRPDRISRRDADGLLDGESAPATGAHRDLAALLGAAAGPARSEELDGEHAAVAAFRREFRPAAAAPARRRSRRRAGVVAALTATILAAGGTAYAATTGRLPDAVQRAVDGVFSGDGPSESPDSAPHSAGVAPTPGGTAADPTRPSSAVPGGPGVDQARLTGLCRSWEATRGNPHTNAISEEDLRVLASAAGGEDRIEAFCAALLSRTPPPPKSDKPGNPNPGGGRPTAPPGGGHTKGGPK